MRLRTLSYGPFSRFLCIVLAAAMVTAPSAAVLAQHPIGEPQAGDKTLLAAPQAAMIDVSYVTPLAVAIANLRPQQILQSSAAQAMPVEVASAAGLKYLGLDPVDVDEIVAFAEPPLPGALQYGVILRLAKPFALSGLGADVRAHTQPAELNGKKYLKSTQLMLPSFYMPDDRTLLVMPDATLRRVTNQQSQPQSSALLDRVRNVPDGSDFYLTVDVAMLRPMINPILAMVVMKQGDKFPEELRPLLETPNLISAAELTFNLSNTKPSSLVVHGNDEASAQKLQSIVDHTLELAQADMKADIAKQFGSDDPVERAYANYMQRMSDQWIDFIRPVRQESTLTIFRTSDNDPATQLQLTNTAVIGVLVALLLPAVQAAREAARRNQSMNNLKQLVLALFNYHDVKNSFPAHATYDANGKPLLSWRVALLPFLQEGELYKQFHLDEPWDSPHNKQLIAQMPEVFQSPGFENKEGKTSYLAVVGKECIFNGTDKGMKLKSITDGTSKTILLVEADADRAVEWTKPADWQYDAKNPQAGLGEMRPGVWLAAWADGHVSAISNAIDPRLLNALFTRNGREVIDPNTF